MNKLERIYNEVQVHGDIGKTSLICSNLFVKTKSEFRVFISISIPYMMQLDPYKNESLVVTLQVEKNCEIEKWLEMKKSSLIAGGFGVLLLVFFKCAGVPLVIIAYILLSVLENMTKGGIKN